MRVEAKRRYSITLSIYFALNTHFPLAFNENPISSLLFFPLSFSPPFFLSFFYTQGKPRRLCIVVRIVRRVNAWINRLSLLGYHRQALSSGLQIRACICALPKLLFSTFFLFRKILASFYVYIVTKKIFNKFIHWFFL